VSLPIVERRSAPRIGARVQAARRILVVDDDMEVRRTLTTLLARQGYDVVTASDGADALARMDDAADRPFDAVITELTLAEVDGVALIRHLRGLRPLLPILVLTGEANPRRRVEAVEAGGDFGFSKPPDFGEMMGILDQLLDARAGGASKIPAPVESTNS
jgi:DNA-binding response OmpR family regulator